MKVYIAAKFEDRERARNFALDLEEIGTNVEVTSRWLSDDHGFSGPNPDIDAHENKFEARRFSNLDLADVSRADALVFLSWLREPGTSSRSFEAGYAFAKNKLVIFVGEIEVIFARMGKCIMVSTEEEALELVEFFSTDVYSRKQFMRSARIRNMVRKEFPFIR